jgi:hypothetical protein
MKPDPILHSLARRTLALATLALAALLCASPPPARAALVDRGGDLVYDTQADMTWLAAPALLPGPSNWLDAATYASNLVHAGGADWLLPDTPFFDSGCPAGVGMGCVDSDMGRLFYQLLGGQAGESVFDATGDSADEIAGVAMMPALANTWFWSWQLGDDGANSAFGFHFGSGNTALLSTAVDARMLLVHAGDLGADLVAPGRVDSPPTLPLVLGALAAAWLLRPARRRPR